MTTKPIFQPGSILHPGWTYQENPFSADRSKVHRKDSGDRLRMLKTYGSFENKVILDLGCSIGYFGFTLKDYSHYIGVDYFAEAIRTAKKLHYEHAHHKKMTFIAKNIDLPLLESLEKHNIDTALVFSVLPWIRNAGADIDEVMKWLAKREVVYFELMYRGDGKSKGLTDVVDDDDARKYLGRYFKFVALLGKDRSWKQRTMWKCTNGFGKTIQCFRSRCSFIEITDRGFVIKKHWHKALADREYRFLKLFEKHDIAPKPVAYGDELGIVMTKINGIRPANKEEVRKLYPPILDALEKEQVLHRDIRPANLLVSEGKMYLIDWEFSVKQGETFDYPETLGSHYRVKGFDNKETFENIIRLKKK